MVYKAFSVLILIFICFSTINNTHGMLSAVRVAAVHSCNRTALNTKLPRVAVLYKRKPTSSIRAFSIPNSSCQEAVEVASRLIMQNAKAQEIIEVLKLDMQKFSKEEMNSLIASAQIIKERNAFLLDNNEALLEAHQILVKSTCFFAVVGLVSGGCAVVLAPLFEVSDLLASLLKPPMMVLYLGVLSSYVGGTICGAGAVFTTPFAAILWFINDDYKNECKNAVEILNYLKKDETEAEKKYDDVD